jgi:hypothetical protein
VLKQQHTEDEHYLIDLKNINIKIVQIQSKFQLIPLHHEYDEKFLNYDFLSTMQVTY